MADPNDSLLQFDSINMDGNENLPNKENSLSNGNVEFLGTVPSKLNSECDIIFSDSLNASEMPLCSENISKIRSEMDNTRDVLTEIPDEVLANNRSADSGIHDSENNIVDDAKLVELNGDELNFSDNCGVLTCDFSEEVNDVQVKDEEFHDAVQFFKDPSSLAFLENAGSSYRNPDPSIVRSSLYVNFDPLHAKFFSQPVSQPVKPTDVSEAPENEPKSNDDIELTENKGDSQLIDVLEESESPSEVVNKHLKNVSPRQSLGNILISFDSPVTAKQSEHSVVEEKKCEPQKMFTEEELLQALKIQELQIHETFLKNQHDLEITRAQKQEELEAKLEKSNQACNALYAILKEVMDVVMSLSTREKELQEKLHVVEQENSKLKEDLKTSEEDLQSVESTFSDFHKRYEQCKSMLKVYTQNEENFKQQLGILKEQLIEKEEMYKALQSRTEEMLEKANIEVASAKKAGDAQVAVLKAQLKKADLKISSLESDVKHVKIENDKLSSICDDLMAKVSEA